MDEKIFENIPKGNDIGKNAKDIVVNNTLNENKEGKNTSEELENHAKTAIKAAKAAGRAAAGDVPGAVKDVVKDENLRKMAMTVIVIVLVIPIMMFSLVPDVLFAPTEEAYGSNHQRVTLTDILKGLFHKNADTEVDLFALPSFDSSFDELIANNMMDDNSLKVIASDNETIPDFDVAPGNANTTMQNMIKVTQG